MLQSENLLVWMDLEMTGLDVEICTIIEIATLITNNDLEVVAINVHDATTQTNLAEMHITRTQFNAPYAYQDFTVNFDLQGRIGHAMELRAFWTDFSYVKVDKVTVALTP